MKINRKQVKEFLDSIKPGESVVILHHNDLDGFASGILIYDYLKKQGINSSHVVVDYGDCVFDYLKNYNKIIVVDLASNRFGKYLEPYGDKLIIIDHHPEIFDSNFLREYNDSDKLYIPTSRTCYELIGGKKWLAVAGVISDAGNLYEENSEFINEFLIEENLSLKEFKEKFVDVLCLVLIFLRKNLTKAFDLIKDLNSFRDIHNLKEYYKPVEEEMDYFIKDFDEKKEDFGNIVFYFFEPEFKIKALLVNYLSSINKDKILVLVSPDKEKDFVSLSIRGEIEGVSALDIAKKGIHNLEGSRVGGHKRACGGVIKKEFLKRFKENLQNCSKDDKNL